VAKVLSLFSGSLASRVATRLAQRHPDVDSVCLLHFRSPFAHEPEDLRQLVKDEWPGISLRTQSLKREYRRLIEATEAESFNLSRSCLSCRRLLLGRAVRYMERTGAQYLVTGEVLGQHGLGKPELLDLAESFGLEDRILRPLCSRSRPDDVGALSAWTKLSNGRKSSGQASAMIEKLAERVGIEPRDPMSCRNRCKLTQPGFGDRVAHLFSEKGFTLNELRLLDFPLYYEIRHDAKVVVAMNEAEKRDLQNLFLPQDLRVYPAAPHGPMTLVRTRWGELGETSREDVIRMAARITATHLGCAVETATPIYYRFESENERMLVNVLPYRSRAEIAVLEGIEVVPLDEASVVVG